LKVDGVGVHVRVSVVIDTDGEGISLGVVLSAFGIALAASDAVGVACPPICEADGVGVNVGVSVGVGVAVGVRVTVGVDVIVGVGVAGGAGMVCPRFTRKYPSVT
jgi:hypothetical protein